MPAIVKNLTAAEAKRLELIHRIQQLHRRGITTQETARITGKDRYTVKNIWRKIPVSCAGVIRMVF